MVATADTALTIAEGQFQNLPVKASTKIYEGAMVGLASGYCRGLVAGDVFVGHADAQADNSATATDGYIGVRVRTGIYRLEATITSVAVTDVGSDVYASADNTLTLTPGSNSFVGKVVRYVTTNTCIVEFRVAYAIASLTVHEHISVADGGALTSPRVVTGINDTNGCELIKVTATGTAVNEITLANAATGNGPTITASGETNVPITLAAKGTGLLTLGQATGSVQIATVATDKIGFFGTTPAVQQAHIADMAGADSVGVNAIIAALETYGILKAS